MIKKMKKDLYWIFNAGNLGVKGFEIEFQKRIELHIPKGHCWWQYVKKNIFGDISEIYKTADENIIWNLTEYYGKIVDEFNSNIKVVTS